MADYELDLSLLTEKLRETEEEAVEADAKAEVNPYLLNVILPLILQGKPPLLREIDFSKFDEDDPGDLTAYCQDRDHRAYWLTEINQTLCAVQPACAKARAFI